MAAPEIMLWDRGLRMPKHDPGTVTEALIKTAPELSEAERMLQLVALLSEAGDINGTLQALTEAKIVKPNGSQNGTVHTNGVGK
ncbi:hypothetical protein HY468_03795 [Candidatus Roizmanbacteria bacterium]|nr:hypothetical protein [Candidatus Roizmanbacteria bacterium]